MRTKVRMMAMLTWMDCLLLRALDSIATPCSVNTSGNF